MTRTPLTKETFDALCRTDKWRIREVDLETIKATEGVERKTDILSAFSSGDANATKMLNNQEAVFGMDVIVHEQRPFRDRGEGDVNVYHYVIKTTGRADFPYLMFGPYTDETLMGHWPTSLDVSVYFRGE